MTFCEVCEQEPVQRCLIERMREAVVKDCERKERLARFQTWMQGLSVVWLGVIAYVLR